MTQGVSGSRGALALASRLLGASVLAQVAVLAAVAIVSRDLHPADFAIFGAVSGVTAISASINTLAVETRTPVVDDALHAVLNRAGSSALVLVNLLTLACGLGLWAVRPEVGRVLVLAAGCAAMQGATQLLTGIVLRRQRQSVLADGRVAQGLSNAVLLLVLWQLRLPGHLVLTLAWMLSMSLGATVLFARGARGGLPRGFARAADWRAAREQVGAQPLANVLASSVGSIPLILLPAVGQTVVAGLWALVNRFLAPLVNTAFATLQPLYYGKAASHVREGHTTALSDLHRRWMKWLLLGGLPVAVGCLIISLVLLPLLGPQWRVGWPTAVAGAIYFSSLFSCLPLSQTLQMLGRVRLSVQWTVVRAIVCLLPMALLGVLGGQGVLLLWAVGAALTFYWQLWLHRRAIGSLQAQAQPQ